MLAPERSVNEPHYELFRAIPICAITSYVGFVAGLILWTYTPLGRKKFAYRPPKPSLKARKVGAFVGGCAGVLFGIVSSFASPLNFRWSDYGLSGYAILVFLSCVGGALIGFVLPYVFVQQ
jgi:hypothetical protein